MGQGPLALAGPGQRPGLALAFTMHRIYFDTNERTVIDCFLLHLAPSLADLAAIPGGPKIGMRLVTYMLGELECEATLDFDLAHASWASRPIEETW